jgi:hypothetical protein
MPLVTQFAPPAFLPDFAGIPGQAEAWHRAVSAWFDSSVASEAASVKNPAGGPGRVQYYNPATLDPGGAIVEQAITWNAFPKELLRQYDRAEALRRADQLRPISAYNSGSGWQGPVLDRTLYRPLTEYCEWHVIRDPDTGEIRKVAFSSEPPEFWQALFGDLITITDTVSVKFPGDRDHVLAMYRHLVSPDVQMEDLICQETIQSADGSNVFALKGQYNPWNKWNTTHGIMHLNAPPNALSAEIQLGADATVLWKNQHGRAMSDPSALICCAAYGGPDRNSDPTIGATVNALARLGAMVTLPNPVGLYMDHIDLIGWSAPDNKPVDDCVRVVRGLPGMIERLEVQVPAARGFCVGDIRIGEEPIAYGGQIAECITVKLVGAAAQIGSVQNAALDCAARCCVDLTEPRLLNRAVPFKMPCPTGRRPAFQHEGSAVPELMAAAGRDQAQLRPAISRHRRLR